MAAGGARSRGRSGRTPTDRTKLALWGAGVVAVFLFEIVALIQSAASGGDAAGTWSILLLIFAPLAVVGVIGGGIARAIRRESDRTSDRERAPDRAVGRAPGPGTERGERTDEPTTSSMEER